MPSLVLSHFSARASLRRSTVCEGTKYKRVFYVFQKIFPSCPFAQSTNNRLKYMQWRILLEWRRGQTLKISKNMSIQAITSSISFVSVCYLSQEVSTWCSIVLKIEKQWCMKLKCSGKVVDWVFAYNDWHIDEWSQFAVFYDVDAVEGLSDEWSYFFPLLMDASHLFYSQHSIKPFSNQLELTKIFLVYNVVCYLEEILQVSNRHLFACHKGSFT